MKSRSKLTKHHIMNKNVQLRNSLPYTANFSKDHLYELLRRYRNVIVKPSFGSGGAGVMLVKTKPNSIYKIQDGSNKKEIKGKDKLYHFLKKKIGSKSHIVQQYIPLTRVNDRPIDIRVIVQKTPKGWKVTGKLTKVAGPGHFITNLVRSKGKVLTIESAIAQSPLNVSSDAIHSQLNQISLEAAKSLAKSYPWIRIVGFDMGIDKTGNIWIIEPNFRPNLFMFLKLKDKSMYKEIMDYKKIG